MKKLLSLLTFCSLVTVMAGTSFKAAVYETPDTKGSVRVANYTAPGPMSIAPSVVADITGPGPMSIGNPVATNMGPEPMTVKAVEQMVAVFETPGPHGIVVYTG